MSLQADLRGIVQDESRVSTGDSVLVTEATRCLLERDGLVPRGAIELKGKPAPVVVYALGAEA